MKVFALYDVSESKVISVFYDSKLEKPYKPDFNGLCWGKVLIEGERNGDEFTPDETEEEIALRFKELQVNKIYNEAISYQVGPNGIDINTDRELSRAQSLLGDGRATSTDLPKAAELGAWLSDTLWGDEDAKTGWYYKGKSIILDGGAYSEAIDEVVGKAPWSFKDLKEERLTFLAQ